VVRAGSDTVVSRLQVGGEPDALIWSAATDLVYCANYPNSVSVISGDGGRVVKTLAVSGSPFAWAMVPQHRRVYLGHLNTRQVYVIRDTAAGFVWEAPDPPQPGDGLIALPNPFCDDVAIDGQAARRVRVYSLAGRLVRTLARGPGRRFPTGIRWDGKDLAGRPVPAGVYFVQAEDGHRTKLVRAR
jgi:DNA-binding beta-propeller fold protein YncE